MALQEWNGECDLQSVLLTANLNPSEYHAEHRYIYPIKTYANQSQVIYLKGHYPKCPSIATIRITEGCYLRNRRIQNNSRYCGQCYDGFNVQLDGTCSDINECLSGDLCLNGTCENTHGGYYCVCNNGFEYDGHACIDINECNTNPCIISDSICINTFGSFECKCKINKLGDGNICLSKYHQPILLLFILLLILITFYYYIYFIYPNANNIFLIYLISTLFCFLFNLWFLYYTYPLYQLNHNLSYIFILSCIIILFQFFVNFSYHFQYSEQRTKIKLFIYKNDQYYFYIFVIYLHGYN